LSGTAFRLFLGLEELGARLVTALTQGVDEVGVFLFELGDQFHNVDLLLDEDTVDVDSVKTGQGEEEASGDGHKSGLHDHTGLHNHTGLHGVTLDGVLLRVALRRHLLDKGLVEGSLVVAVHVK